MKQGRSKYLVPTTYSSENNKNEKSFVVKAYTLAINLKPTKFYNGAVLLLICIFFYLNQIFILFTIVGYIIDDF